MTYTLWTNSNRSKAGAPGRHQPDAASITAGATRLALAVSLLLLMGLASAARAQDMSNYSIDNYTAWLSKYADAKQALPGNRNTGPTRKQRHFNRHTVTMLTNNDSKPYSILEVLCPDRPGLLAVIAHIFVDMGITLHNAKITTLGENVEDVFFITDRQDRKLLDSLLGAALQARIRERLDAETTGQAA